jgi:hypothetical protein
MLALAFLLTATFCSVFRFCSETAEDHFRSSPMFFLLLFRFLSFPCSFLFSLVEITVELPDIEGFAFERSHMITVTKGALSTQGDDRYENLSYQRQLWFAMNKDAELNWSDDDDDDDGGYDGSEKSEAPNKCDERPKEGDERYE